MATPAVAAPSVSIFSSPLLIILIFILLVGLVVAMMKQAPEWCLMLLVFAFGFILGQLPAQAVSGGPGAVLAWGLLTGGLYAALACYLGVILFNLQWYERSSVATILVAGIAFFVTIYPAAHTIANGHEYAAYLRSMAAPTQEFGIRHFSEIDADDNAILTTEEMNAAVSRGLGERGHALLQHMNSQRSEIGHVIDTHTSYVWISTGQSGYLSRSTQEIYGISRSDLQSYPQRLAEKWKKW